MKHNMENLPEINSNPVKVIVELEDGDTVEQEIDETTGIVLVVSTAHPEMEATSVETFVHVAANYYIQYGLMAGLRRMISRLVLNSGTQISNNRQN